MALPSLAPTGDQPPKPHADRPLTLLPPSLAVCLVAFSWSCGGRGTVTLVDKGWVLRQDTTHGGRFQMGKGALLSKERNVGA